MNRGNTLRNKVGERNKVLPAMLSAATVHDVRGHVVVIAHGSPVLGARVTQPHNAAVICEVLAEMFGGTWQVEYQEGAPTAPTVSSATKATEAPSRPAAAPRFSRPSQERAAQQPQGPAAPARRFGRHSAARGPRLSGRPWTGPLLLRSTTRQLLRLQRRRTRTRCLRRRLSPLIRLPDVIPRMLQRNSSRTSSELAASKAELPSRSVCVKQLSESSCTTV